MPICNHCHQPIVPTDKYVSMAVPGSKGMEHWLFHRRSNNDCWYWFIEEARKEAA